MDDLFGGLGEMLGGFFGGEASAEGAMGLVEMFSPDGREQRPQAVLPIAYERYLCGGPRKLHINDR